MGLTPRVLYMYEHPQQMAAVRKECISEQRIYGIEDVYYELSSRRAAGISRINNSLYSQVKYKLYTVNSFSLPPFMVDVRVKGVL